jgi:hypothetical protein
VPPRALFCHPEASAEGSPLFSPKMRCFASLSMTGWRMSRRATPFCHPEPFFVTPRRQPRGLPGDAVPSEVRRDAVPNEVRDASLSLGTTKNGGSAGQSEGQDRVWRFLASLETTEKAVAPCPFLSPRAQARGPSAPTRPGKTRWKAVAPSGSEGSLGAYTPREDTVGGCHPERSEGSLGTCVPRSFL